MLLVKYVTLRPMLLSAILCTLTSFIAYNRPDLLIFIGLLYLILIPSLIIKKADIKYILVFLLALLMLFSSVNSLNEIKSFSWVNNLETSCNFTVYETDFSKNDYNIAYCEIIECKHIKKGTKILIRSKSNLEIGTTYRGDLIVSSFKDSSQKASYVSKKIYLSAYCSNIKICDTYYEGPLRLVKNTRNHIKNCLFENLKYENAATMTALIFGKKDYFTDKFYKNVKLSGVSHVMVVSGMHLAIIISLFEKIIRKFIYNRKLRAIIIFIIVILISTLCGFTMSIIRAGLTYVIFALSLLFNRRNCAENSLGTAVTITLLFSPFAALNISFQLSVLSTFGILSIALPVNNYLSENIKIPKPLSLILQSIIISLSAILLTLPVIIFTYGWISKTAIISNLLVSGAVTLDLWITFTALIINPVLPVISRHILFKSADIITGYVNYVINAIELVKNPAINLPVYTIVFSLITILAILYLLLACKKRNNMIKSKEMLEKIQKEGGKKFKWQ